MVAASRQYKRMPSSKVNPLLRRSRHHRDYLHPHYPQLAHKDRLKLLTDPFNVYTDGAGQFTAANGKYLSVASNSTLQIGDVDFFLSCWVRFDSTGTNRPIIAKWDNTGTNREYLIFLDTSTQLAFVLYDGSSQVNVADTGLAVATDTWYFILAWHDKTNNTANLKINNRTTVTESITGGVNTTTTSLAIGGYSNGSPYTDGQIAQVYLAKPPTAIADLIDGIHVSLYNSGNGKFYRDLTSTEISDWGLVSAWLQNPADIAAGSFPDSHGSNNLTDNNSVGYAVGPTERRVWADGQPVSTWRDFSGNGNHLTQTDASKRPLWKVGVLNGLPASRFDGTDDFMLNSAFTLPSKVTVGVAYTNRTGTNGTLWGTNTGLGPLQRDSGGTQAAIWMNAGVSNFFTSDVDPDINLNNSRWLLTKFNFDDDEYSAELDNNPDTLGSSTTSTSLSGTGFSLGARSSGSENLNGDIAEAVIVSEILSDRKLSDYAQRKYAPFQEVT